MQILPYLRFNDEKCVEAMNFYKSVLGGELILQKVGETPMAKDMPPETHHRIMHASLKTGSAEIFGSDMMRDKAVIGDNVSVAINFDDTNELKDKFNKMKAGGGEVFMEPEVTDWGTFGMLTDQYGIEWMFNSMKK